MYKSCMCVDTYNAIKEMIVEVEISSPSKQCRVSDKH